MLLAEPDPEPGVDERRVGRGDDRVVARRARVDPAGRRRAVQVADDLGLGDGVAGALDPDVRSPRRDRAGAEQVADDRAAAEGDGARRPILGGQRLDRDPRHGRILEARGQPRLDQPLGAWRSASSRAASSMCSSRNGRISSRAAAHVSRPCRWPTGPARMTRRTPRSSSSSTRSARWPTAMPAAIRDAEHRQRVAARGGDGGRQRDARCDEVPHRRVERDDRAGQRRRADERARARRRPRSRGRRSGPARRPSRPATMASLTSSSRSAGFSRAMIGHRAGWTWLPSAISSTYASSSSSAATATPGAR